MTKFKHNNTFRRAALTLLALIMTCAAAWAQTVNYYFFADGTGSYIVYNANKTKLTTSPAGGETWNSAAAVCGNVGVLINRVEGYGQLSIIENQAHGYSSNGNPYSFRFQSTNNKYITKIKIFTDSGQHYEADNDQKSFTTPALLESDGYGKFFRVTLILNNTPPVYTYNITYELNGGTNAPNNPSTYTNITGATLADATRTGYTFNGWYDNAEFNGDPITYIQAGMNGNKTVYAKWTVNTYTVAFDANGGSGTMSNQSFTYDVAQNLTSNAFTRTGYTYNGWNTAANGSGTAYTNGQSVENLTTTNGATVTLYAQWNPITYTVSFNANGGTGTMAAQTHTYGTSLPLTFNTFTRTGYSFAGWATTANGDVVYTDGQGVQNLASTQGTNVELFAKWTIDTYTLSYNLNGGSLPEGANPTTYTVESPSFTLANPVRTAYAFSGWTGTGLDEPTMSVTVAQGSTGNRTYTATWTFDPSAYWGEGNDGSYAHPYIITTTAGLDLLATLVSDGNDFSGKYFRLGADIEYNIAEVNNFTPIGRVINRDVRWFNGNFNGQGSDNTQYEISGINIYKPDDSNLGLFGMTQEDARLDNIVLRNATITGHSFAGGIVGNNNGHLYNCRVLNTSVTAIQVVSGVICGNSFNDYRLNDNYYYNCSAKKGNGAAQTANIGTGNHYDVNGAKSIHTLTLGNYVSTSTSPTLTYKGTDYYAVGTPITLSYSGTVSEGQILFYTVNGEVIDGNTFNMPSDRANATAAAVLDINIAYYWGNGDGTTAENAYVISTPSGLNVLATMTKNGEHYSGKFFRLGADIDMSGINFNGIGVGTGNSFSGTLDGGIYDSQGTLTGRHTISGINISRNETAGFFMAIGHYVYDSQTYIGGTVRNLVLEGTVSSGSSSSVGRIGGLAGIVFENSTVENCVSLLLVQPGYPIDYKGSLIGTNDGTVRGCHYLGMGGPGANVALNAMGNGNEAINCTPLYSVEAASGGDYPVTMSSMTTDGTLYGDRYHVAGTHVTMTLTAPEREGYALTGFKYQVYNENTYSYDDVNLTDNNDGTYTLTMPAMNVTIEANYSYSGLAGLAQDEQNRYLITSMDDLRAVATAVDALDGCAGMTFLLANDIENAGAFSGLAVGTINGFTGTFDGDGHTISGMTIESDAYSVGFIGNLNGTLQNLTLKNCTVTAVDNEYAEAGMLTGNGWGSSMYHCRVLGGTVTAPYASAIANNPPDNLSDNRYDVGVVVVSDGVIRNPGECGTSYGDLGYSNATVLPVEYLDANGDTVVCTEEITRLEGGGATTLAGGWYVAAYDIDYTGTVTLDGDVHLILMDNAVMNVTSTDVHGIDGTGHSINIYAQSMGESKGQLHVNANVANLFGIYTEGGNINIYGGKVIASGSNYGLYCCDGNLSINGGQVTANGGNYGIYVSGGDITLGWTDPDDFILASSYYCYFSNTLSIASGQVFTDEYDNIYSGTITKVNGAYPIDGKTLSPYILPTVSYLDENGDTQTKQPNEYTLLTGGGATTLGGGWYVVTSNITFTDMITCTGDAHFILCDGYTMNVGTAESPVSYGIFGNEHSISIYAQSTGESKGQLHVYTSENGIYATGGGNITVNGGQVSSTGYNGIYTSNGNITLNGGEVSATSQGSDVYDRAIFADGGNITISGGEVTANGSCGITADGGNITISGGEVEATGSSYGGGGIVVLGYGSNTGVLSISNATVTASASVGIFAMGDLTINSGTVTANCNGEYGYGIQAYGCDLTITGGTVTATGAVSGSDSYGINVGGNLSISGGQVTASSNAFDLYSDSNLTISGGQVTTSGDMYSLRGYNINISGGQVSAAGSIYTLNDLTLGWTNPNDFIYANSYLVSSSIYIATGKTLIADDGNTYSGQIGWDIEETCPIDGKTLYPYIEGTVPYIDANGQLQILQPNQYTVLNGTETTLGTTGEETWYVANSIYEYSHKLSLIGDIHLILCDGADVYLPREYDDEVNYHVSIKGDDDLTIYGQTNGTGTLRSNMIFTDGAITINGGQVTVYAYGLTNSEFSEASILTRESFTLNGGTIYIPVGNKCVDVIPFGTVNPDVSYNCTINGGTVNVSGNNYGIHAYGNVTINGGQVTAWGGESGIAAKNLILGWTQATDYIYANSYSVSNNKTIVAGQAFTDNAGNIYCGTLNYAQLEAMFGKTLYPLVNAVTRTIEGYGDSTTEGWVFISSPVSGSITPNTVTNIFSATEYDLYRFNQSAANGKEWQNYKAHTSDFNLVNGQGYLYATKETKTLVFTGEFNTDNTKTVDLVYDNNAELKGWNLVGNPFITTATLSQPYYRMNDEGTALKTETETSAVAAMEGVFVQATGNDQTVTFTAQTRGGEQSAVAMLNVLLGKVPEPVEGPTQNNGVSTSSTTLTLDNAIVRFDGGQTLEKFSFREGSTKLYIPQGGTDYAIVCAEGHGELPVNFEAEKNGTHTLSFSSQEVSFSYLHLIDNMTGDDIDLLPHYKGGRGDSQPATYTFQAKTTDYASRFKLVFVTDGEDSPSTGSETFAYYNGSEWMISNTGRATLQVVDAMGRVLRSETINGNATINTNGLSAGVYMLRLINSEDVRVQKVVVR